MTPGMLILSTLVGAILPVAGHLVGAWITSRVTPAPAPAPAPVVPVAVPVVPADPFAGLPGLPGHPALNSLNAVLHQQGAAQAVAQDLALLAQVLMPLFAQQAATAAPAK